MCDRPVQPAEKKRLGAVIKADLEDHWPGKIKLDASVSQPNQPNYLPPGGRPVGRLGGDAIDVDDLIGRWGEEPPRKSTRKGVKLAGIDPERARQRAEEYIQLMGEIRNGECDAAIRKAALYCHDTGCDPEVAAHVIIEKLAFADPPPVDDITGRVKRFYESATEPQGCAAPEAVFREIAANLPPEETVEKTEKPAYTLKPTPFVYRDPETIPPREWLYGKHYIRKFITSTVAAGGVGKSSHVLCETLAMVSGRPLLGIEPDERNLRAWYWNGEDPLEEVERRVAAICKHYALDAAALEGRLFLDSGRSQKIKIAHTDKTGTTVAEPVVGAVIEAILATKIDVMIIDPFVSSHSVAENDNSAMQTAVEAWAYIADVTSCAIELVHHVRKTNGAEVTAEDGRGASAVKDATRDTRALNVMTKEEAEACGHQERRRSFYRYGDGKNNLSPPADKSEWFRIVSVCLGNATSRPADKIGVVTKWEWPNAFAGVAAEHLGTVKAILAGGEYAESAQAKNWAGNVVADVVKFDASTAAGKARAKAILRAWIERGALDTEIRRNTRTGRDQRIVTAGGDGE